MRYRIQLRQRYCRRTSNSANFKTPTQFLFSLLIKVKVIPGTGKPEFSGEILVVHTSERFEKGLANRDVVAQIAEYYGVSQGKVIIKRGFTSRRKLVEVTGI